MYKAFAAATLTLALVGAGCATAPVAYYPVAACDKVVEKVRPNGTVVTTVRPRVC